MRFYRQHHDGITQHTLKVRKLRASVAVWQDLRRLLRSTPERSERGNARIGVYPERSVGTPRSGGS
jgi:hypothetical protein